MHALFLFHHPQYNANGNGFPNDIAVIGFSSSHTLYNPITNLVDNASFSFTRPIVDF